jgi:uncharacterized membrane protein YphA (DoxX/SURF4 family)
MAIRMRRWLGVFCWGAIFLLSGINKIADPAGTQGYMVAMGIMALAR